MTDSRTLTVHRPQKPQELTQLTLRHVALTGTVGDLPRLVSFRNFWFHSCLLLNGKNRFALSMEVQKMEVQKWESGLQTPVGKTAGRV